MIIIPVDLALLMSPLLGSVPGHAKATVAMAVLAVVLLNVGGRYRSRRHLSVLDEMPFVVGSLLIAAAVVATVIALRHERDAVLMFLTDTAVVLGLVVAGRVLATWVLKWARRHGVARQATLLIGGGPVAADLARLLAENPDYGLDVVGCVDDDDRGFVPGRPDRIADLDEAIVARDVEVLLVADGDMPETTLLDAVRTQIASAADLLVVPRLHHFHTQTGRADHIGSIPIMRIRTPSLRGPMHAVKRLFDFAVAGVLLVLAAPLLAVCALAVRLESGPGVLFRQPRVGRDGLVFDCLKLRSMRPVSAEESATNWSIAADDRVGPVGRALRRTSLDELPQLWNILRGDMTLVGPRPERPHFVSIFSGEYYRYDQRHRMRAGLTGLAQVSGLRGNSSIADRARFDNYYIENWSLWMDVKILLRTCGEVLFARGR